MSISFAYIPDGKVLARSIPRMPRFYTLKWHLEVVPQLEADTNSYELRELL